MTKKLHILLLLLFCFLIVGCGKTNGDNTPGTGDNPSSGNDLHLISVSNYYNFEKCYVTYLETNEKIELTLSENSFTGHIKDDAEIIIHDDHNSLPETTFHKEKPYYYNTKWFSKEINPDNIVYFSVDNAILNPELVFDVEGTNVCVPMRFYKSGIYYGYIDSRSSTYYYQDSITFEKSDELTYSTNNYYKNNALTKLEDNTEPDIPINPGDSNIPENAIFMNIPDHWVNCYYYMWNNEGNDERWPGKQAIKVSDNIYYFLFDESYPNFIFNCGPEGAAHPTQTENLHIDMCGSLVNPMYSLVNKEFVEYTGGGDFDNPIYDYTETSIFVVIPTGWEHLYVNYEYAGNVYRNELKYVENNIYTGLVYKNCDYVYFDDGGSNKTTKYNFNSNRPYYNNGTWDVFDEDLLLPIDPVLPENPEFNDDLDIYNALFDINNKIRYEIHISESEILKIQKDYEKFRNMGSKSPIYRKCNLVIWINDESFTIEEVGIRMKGNTSRRDFYSENDGIFALIHYKLKFNETFDDVDEYGDEAKVWENDVLRKERKNRTFATLEGLEMKWNKNYDGTHIRSYLAHDLYEKNGYMAQNLNIAQVSITQFGTLENLGIFDVAEPVDEIFLEKHLPENELGGDLYKVGWTNKGGSLTKDTLDSIGKEDELNGKFYVYDLKTNKKTSDNSALINFINTINTSGSDLSSVCDMERFTKFAALSYMAGNPDDYRYNYNNYYLYFLKSSNKAVFIPYDMDRCYGTTRDMNPFGSGTSKVDPLTTKYSFGDQVNPLILRSITHNGEAKYVSMYLAYLNEFANNEYFSMSYITPLYTLAKSYYQNVYKPSIDRCNWAAIKFTMDDDNYSVSQYITNIKEQIRNAQ